ncbi:MAG TPA: UvrD-helicase domain-containing protein, partial [bacterium]|nr:UvrD-helicase domain-containing protein [bacterium]
YPLDAELMATLNLLQGTFTEGTKYIQSYNNLFVQKELTIHSDLFDKLEKFPLNPKQREAIVRDEDHVLVIAGAGTGKTSTLIGKAIYLLKTGRARPDDVLILTFTRNAAKEVLERIQQKCTCSVLVSTFHAFGLKILAESLNCKPDLAFENDADQKKFIECIFRQRLKETEFSRLVLEFFAYYLRPYKSIESFKNQGEYVSYLKRNDIRTLMGERVKSFEEMEIANFLYLHGVDYQYEAEYKYNTKDRDHRQYKPDFYLVDYGIYIEHFAFIEESKTRVPDWFSTKDGKSPNQVYAESYRWKIQIHNKYNTVMIETFSYEKKNGTLFKTLQKRLIEQGVKLQDPDFNQFRKNGDIKSSISQFGHLLYSFLNLFKANNGSIDQLHEKSYPDQDYTRTSAFLCLFEQIYIDYQRHLKDIGKIDFNDMLIEAKRIIENGLFKVNYSYVLVDEFQDTSLGRYALLKAMLNQNARQRLFCVGDDWQSIFRFTGSDISVITEFSENFGFSEIVKLTTTYRFTDKICSLTSQFIQKNLAQVRKDLVTVIQSDQPAYKILFREGQYSGSVISKILEELSQNARTEGVRYSVFIIGRYRFIRPSLFHKLALSHPFIDLKFYTAHGVKGLEADYVIIDGLIAGKYGFPTEIADDPLLGLVLNKPDFFSNAEERRLFYVAMTRARKKIYFITDRFNYSYFLQEIDPELNGLKKCPTCQNGLLVRKMGSYGEFWGCSNFPYCDYRKSLHSKSTK